MIKSILTGYSSELLSRVKPSTKILKSKVDATWTKLINERICIGITGFSGSGKSSFITSLIYQLSNSEQANLSSFSPAIQGRIKGVKILTLDGLTDNLFQYQQGLNSLSSDPASWPESTTDLSSCLLEVSYQSHNKSFFSGESTNSKVLIEIRDYPGEWLLDIPLLNQSYYQWCLECNHRFQQPEIKPLLAELLDDLSQIDLMAQIDEQTIKRLHQRYVTFLQSCKQAGLSLIQPGRFLLPGNEPSDILPFVPLLGINELTVELLSDASQDSYFKQMKTRYEQYVENQVKPFYDDYFNNVHRQIILVDVLKGLSKGEAYLEDMRLALARVMDSYHYGRNNLYQRTFNPQVEQIVFVATKIDQVLPEQHENIRSLLSSLVSHAYIESNVEGIDMSCEAVAAVRCTKLIKTNDKIVLEGHTTEGKKGGMFHPDIPSTLPKGSDWQQYKNWQVHRLRPLENKGLLAGDKLEHIRMDTVLNQLIGDKFK
ncbi:MAG: YcjX family protein [Methylomarinum sp.]|nr:YcjX family protein [Methylomarinum sp.]